MKNLLLILLITISSIVAKATHNRAGEITCKQIDALSYEITLTTYTYTPSAANETREKLPINWGDNTEEFIEREEVVVLPDQYSKNVYKGFHTFPGPGIYKIVMEDPNRNNGVSNIPGSVNVVFSIFTILKIDASVGFNTTPVLLNPPLDKALTGQVFIHNPAAYDVEGDSISYLLTTCRQENGEEIPGYTLPPASDSIYVDAITGDLIWDTPTEIGVYNVAMMIEEWRTGVKIGQIVRDMQIEVTQGNNIKPEILPLQDFCVEAGENLSFLISASDVDFDRLLFTYSGGPFETDPAATLNEIQNTLGNIKYEFSWITDCSLVRNAPYQAVFRVSDTLKNPSLADYKNTMITVVAPAPKDLVLSSSFNSIYLSWNPSICSKAIGYDIYRKKSPSGWNPSDCELGVPAYVGFEKIASLLGYSIVDFTDNNDSKGLEQGYNYCYKVVAIFEDGAESYASEEQCTELKLGYPLITKVSVDSTDNNKGRIELNWSKFTDYDPVVSPGPYVYLIYQSDDFVGQNLTLIDSTDNALSDNDTIYRVKNLNTENQKYSFSVEMYNNTLGNRHLLGDPQLASAPFLSIIPDDNKLHLKIEKSTPWVNDSIIIYRRTPSSLLFDSIGYSTSYSFVDSNLVNDQEYCYYAQTIGHYPPSELSYYLINNSQKVCAKPQDTIAPCPPKYEVTSYCEEFFNRIHWSVADSCLEDIVSYNIYYSPFIAGDLELIYTAIDKSDTVFDHYANLSIAGCYSVTAVDSFANESPIQGKVCIDNCTYYELPNVFTPNGDNKNDFVIPGPYKYIHKIDMKIYNRWGTLVFETEDPDINWNGRFMENGKILSPGVYYYICDVYEYRLTGIETRVLTGFIHLYVPKAYGEE